MCVCEDGAGESHSVALLLAPRDGYSFIAVIYVRVHIYTSDTYSNTSTHTSDMLTKKNSDIRTEPVIYVLKSVHMSTTGALRRAPPRPARPALVCASGVRHICQ